MSTSFVKSPSLMLTSESVTEGHPDKLCDQISDAVLDAIICDDPHARVACEVAATTGFVIVMGEITTSTYVDIPVIVRETVKSVGYTHAKYGFDYETCGVLVSIKEQSKDIAQGVDRSLELREGEPRDGAGARRRRPGDDGRLRLRGDAGADAAADLAGAPAVPSAGRGAQGRHAATTCGRTASRR